MMYFKRVIPGNGKFVTRGNEVDVLVDLVCSENLSES